MEDGSGNFQGLWNAVDDSQMGGELAQRRVAPRLDDSVRVNQVQETAVQILQSTNAAAYPRDQIHCF